MLVELCSSKSKTLYLSYFLAIGQIFSTFNTDPSDGISDIKF